MLITAVLAAICAMAFVPAALATPTGSVTVGEGNCTAGSTTFGASLTVNPAHAFNPLFVRNTDTGSFAGVLVPNAIMLNGETLDAGNTGLDTSALSGALASCTFATGRGTFEVTGILAPTIP